LTGTSIKTARILFTSFEVDFIFALKNDRKAVKTPPNSHIKISRWLFELSK